jgi:penicillin-binding protein 1A
LQEGANQSLRSHLSRFDRGHGYHGAEKRVQLARNATETDWQEALQGLNPVAGMRPAVITKVDRKAVVAYLTQVGQVILQGEDLHWGGRYRPVHVGDVVRLQPRPEGGWHLAQIPNVEGALVSLDPGTGAIQALVGGFDFEQSKFNRATQARRQPGSSFKPFVYSAALDAGYTPSTIVLDAPIEFHVPGLVGGVWRPENAGGKSYGPTRLRDALAFSRNVVSVRLLNDIGVERGVKYFKRFGFAPEQLKPNLSLSLGTAELTPLEMATGYAVFANGGYLVKPYIIDRIEDYNGQVVLKTEPPKLCADCDQGQPLELDENADDSNFSLDSQSAPRVIDPQNAYQVSSMMRDVIRIGTGKPAQVLRRKDLSGKTGTTNDVKDVWFAGFNTRIVTAVWMGTDKNDSLGNSESGGSLALPIWIDYMRVALKDVPQSMMKQPSGMVTVRVDKSSGRLASVGNRNAVMETFRAEDMEKLNAEGIQAQPRISRRSHNSGGDGGGDGGSGIPDQLF